MDVRADTSIHCNLFTLVRQVWVCRVLCGHDGRVRGRHACGRPGPPAPPPTHLVWASQRLHAASAGISVCSVCAGVHPCLVVAGPGRAAVALCSHSPLPFVAPLFFWLDHTRSTLVIFAPAHDVSCGQLWAQCMVVGNGGAVPEAAPHRRCRATGPEVASAGENTCHAEFKSRRCFWCLHLCWL
jgi:hypothetical protein